MRPAADYVASLRDGRAVFLDGERVAERYEAARQAPDVTECVDPPAARGSAQCG